VTSRVVIVGDAMLDVVVRPLAAFAPTSDMPASVRVVRGGSGANLAVAIRAVTAQALDVVFAGVVGHDAAAQIVRRDLEESGVVAHLSSLEGSTGVVVSLVGDTGERAMLTERGVNGELTFEHVVDLFDEHLVHVHVSGYTVLDVATRVLVPRLLDAATARGATTSVDVCSVGPLMVVGPATFALAVRSATMLFANEEEALVLSGDGDVEDALETLSRQWREVVITRGPLGALACRDGETVTVAAQRAEVVDTTGAGDSATGTYLAHRLAGEDVPTALTFAMAAAARVVRGLGSRG
jgi:sugar/nucleoside kinase (ribokinase family)